MASLQSRGNRYRRPRVAVALEIALIPVGFGLDALELVGRLRSMVDDLEAGSQRAVDEAIAEYTGQLGARGLDAELEHAARGAGQPDAAAELADHTRVEQQPERDVDVDLVAGGGADGVEVDELGLVVADQLEGDPLVVEHGEGHRTEVRTDAA